MNTLTNKQILEETANYYSINPKKYRALTIDGDCVYYIELENGECQKCGIGRCLVDAESFQKDYNFDPIGSIFQELTYKKLDDYLLPQYHGKKLDFWEDVQDFHDVNPNWSDTGLTENGKLQLNELINKWGKL